MSVHHQSPQRPAHHPALHPEPAAVKPKATVNQPAATPTAADTKPAPALPWEATLPYKLDEAPMPLTTTKVTDAALLGDVFGHYSDGPAQTFQPTPAAETAATPTRDQRIATERTQLEAANAIAGHLSATDEAPYLEGRLSSLQKFSQQVAPADAGVKSVPDELVGDSRPLIEKLERLPAVPGQAPVSTNPEAAHVGTGADWNTKLGVPEYRSQSTNLIPPEASCNMTSLAMSLERVGYGRESAMTAIDLQLKEQYLAEQRQQMIKQHKDPSTLPAAKDVVLPAGYFENNVKQYMKSIQDSADKPYQGVRGKTTNEHAWDQIAAQYHDNAQFQDTLDFLRYLTKAGDRTDLDTVAPKLIEKLEPDKDKRPTYRNITPGRDMNWQTARGQLSHVLDEGGSAMLSYEHKGGNNTEASHIISVQSMTPDGVVVDDPYGHARDDYRLNQVGDAYGPKGGGPRSVDRKNQVDTGTVSRTDPSQVDMNWTANRGQNLKDSESHGESVSLPNDVFSSSWRSLRFIEPAHPRPQPTADATAATPVGPGH